VAVSQAYQGEDFADKGHVCAWISSKYLVVIVLVDPALNYVRRSAMESIRHGNATMNDTRRSILLFLLWQCLS
jgi:hypothetical protein